MADPDVREIDFTPEFKSRFKGYVYLSMIEFADLSDQIEVANIVYTAFPSFSVAKMLSLMVEGAGHLVDAYSSNKQTDAEEEKEEPGSSRKEPRSRTKTKFYPDYKSFSEYLVKRIYNYLKKNWDLYSVVKEGDTVEPGEKRIRTKNGPKSTVVTSASQGYGEIGIGSLTKILKTLESLQGGLALGKDSAFLDIGSGFGKVVLHTKLYSGVKTCKGIEYVEVRHRGASETLEHFRKVAKAESENPDDENAEHMKVAYSLLSSGIDFEHKDATQYNSFPFTHIYMYDKVFTRETHEAIVKSIMRSSFLVLVSYKTLRELTSLGMTGIKRIMPIKTNTTGGQQHTAHIYCRDTVAEY